MIDERRIAIVIPAYNEAATIRDVATSALQRATWVVVIDDGSTDGTSAALRDLPVTLLANDCNLGKAGSLWRGMQHALELGAEAIVTLDGDGQHCPEDIPRLVQEGRAHPHDIVIGARLAGRQCVPRLRDVANRTANLFISRAAGYRIADSQSGFRLYPASLLRRLRIPYGTSRGFVFESELLIAAARLGVRSRPVVIEAIYRPGARGSHYRPIADTLRIARMVAVQLACSAISGSLQSPDTRTADGMERQRGEERS